MANFDWNYSQKMESVTDSVDKGNYMEGGGSPYQQGPSGTVTEDIHSENGDVTSASSCTRNLRARGQRRFAPEKIRYKKTTLQEMTKPLKHWLFRNSNNPYPNRTEKKQLAGISHMSLTQVSNWFANARRRLKNTVNDPGVGWKTRIKEYNNHVKGNAELLSISSDDSLFDSDEGDCTSTNTFQADSVSCDHSSDKKESDSANNIQMSPFILPKDIPKSSTDIFHPKYKQSILHRYLTDSSHGQFPVDVDSFQKCRSRNHSGSLGSRDYEEMSTSSGSVLSCDARHGHWDDFTEELEEVASRKLRNNRDKDEMYWKEMEITATLALTSLARKKSHDTK